MEYIAFRVTCKESYREIIMAEMSDMGFDSFLETEDGFEAYEEPDKLDRKRLEAVFQQYQQEAHLSVQENLVPKVNWNKEWERHYEPIEVEETVYIRASFHPLKEDYPFEILINPKMSFGTGHHATTYLMIQLQLNVDHKDKMVMDAGSGTGILAIMAKKLGANLVVAFDIDEWSVDNGNENFHLNGFEDLEMKTGTISSLDPKGSFDIIMANINKNVLLDEMEVYSRKLKPGGMLLLSGFYHSDIKDLLPPAKKAGLELLDRQTRNDWSALKLVRSK